MLKVCDQFKSVSALKDFICSCLRAEAIKLVAARVDKIGFAHGQANNFLITKRLEGGGLSLKDTQYVHDVATRFMAEDTSRLLHELKHTRQQQQTYHEKKEQEEHIAMLLSFYETHKDNVDRGCKKLQRR